MDNYMGMPYCAAVLYNEDKTLALTIGFLGYTFSDMEKYLAERFVNSDKPYAKRWFQMKYIGINNEDMPS